MSDAIIAEEMKSPPKKAFVSKPYTQEERRERDEKELEEFGYNVSDFHSKRCAIHISKPDQIDFQNKILMLEDERVICYDRLYIT